MSERTQSAVPPEADLPGFPDPEPGTFAELIGDCRRIAPHWVTQHKAAQPPTAPSSIHGTKVSTASAHVVDGMSEYGS